VIFRLLSFFGRRPKLELFFATGQKKNFFLFFFQLLGKLGRMAGLGLGVGEVHFVGREKKPGKSWMKN
jgi:hypothetical protein